jgi:hypothetical protein
VWRGDVSGERRGRAPGPARAAAHRRRIGRRGRAATGRDGQSTLLTDHGGAGGRCSSPARSAAAAARCDESRGHAGRYHLYVPPGLHRPHRPVRRMATAGVGRGKGVSARRLAGVPCKVCCNVMRRLDVRHGQEHRLTRQRARRHSAVDCGRWRALRERDGRSNVSRARTWAPARTVVSGKQCGPGQAIPWDDRQLGCRPRSAPAVGERVSGRPTVAPPSPRGKPSTRAPPPPPTALHDCGAVEPSSGGRPETGCPASSASQQLVSCRARLAWHTKATRSGGKPGDGAGRTLRRARPRHGDRQ